MPLENGTPDETAAPGGAQPPARRTSRRIQLDPRPEVAAMALPPTGAGTDGTSQPLDGRPAPAADAAGASPVANGQPGPPAAVQDPGAQAAPKPEPAAEADPAAPSHPRAAFPAQAQPTRGGLLGSLTASLSHLHPPRGPSKADQCLPLDEVEKLRRRAVETNAVGDIAEEISAALALAERIRIRNIYVEDASRRLNFILDCLLADPARLVLAQDGRLRMQVEVYHNSGIISRTLAKVSSGSPVSLVLCALGISLAFGLLSFAILYQAALRIPADSLLARILFMDGGALIVMTCAAFIGGVVSIGTRLKEFSRVRDLDPFAMFWTAMLKPLLGVILAVVVLAALAGGIINFEGVGLRSAAFAKGAVAPQTLYILWLVGFITGFSERFAWDFVDRAQGSFGVGAPVPPPGTAGRGGAATT